MSLIPAPNPERTGASLALSILTNSFAIVNRERSMLKLILADNQAIFRAGIAKVLAVEDEMRIVAQAQTTEQMLMALDKCRAAGLGIAGGFPSAFHAVVSAANKSKTRVVVLADTGE